MTREIELHPGAHEVPFAQNPVPKLLEGRYAHLGFLSMDDFGAVGDGDTDDTAAVQAAFNAAVSHRIELRSKPGRKYKLSDTIYVGPDPKGHSPYASFVFNGSNCGYDPDVSGRQLRGCAFVSTVTDRPAFALQSLRFASMANCTIMGRLVHNGKPSFDAAAYTSGFRTSRYSPHAGLAVDPYSGGCPPDGGYPGASPFGATGSYKVTLSRVRIIGFVCGVVVQPSGFDGNASSVSMDDGEIDQCCYGWSVCGAQNRNCLIKNSNIANCHVGVTNATHGARQGSIPKVFGGEWGSLARLFYVSSNIDTLCVEGLYCEACRSIGLIGDTFSAPHGAVFNGCNFFLRGGTPGYTAACILDHAMPVTFNGCNITVDGSAVGIVSRRSQAQFSGCLFCLINGDGWMWLPNLDGTYLPELRGCVVSSSGIFGALNATRKAGVNTEGYVTHGEMSAAKSLRYLPTARRMHTDGNTYTLKPPRDLVAVGELSRSAYVRVATTGHYTFTSTSLTITAVHGGDFAKGDVLLWPMLPVSASVPTELPALGVTSVLGNRVTCSLLFGAEEYDETSQLPVVKIIPRYWAWNPLAPPLWGRFTRGSTTVLFSGRDPRDYLMVGDFVFQEELGIARGIYRVVSMTATSVVLSRAAGASSSEPGSPLTFGECAREGGRFVQTFSSTDLVSNRYLFVTHGMQGRNCMVQIFDSHGNVFVPSNLSVRGSGVITVDLGTSHPPISGTWTAVGMVVEAEAQTII